MTGLLVLGASGLLGRAVVDEARRIGIGPVTGVGRSALGAERADRWQEIDLSGASVASVTALLESADASAIINCAGRTAGDRPSLSRANVTTVAMLLEALSRHEATPRLVHVASAAEYAAVAEGKAIREDDRLDPQTAYGITKLAASRLVDVATREQEVDGVVARVFNPLGPRMPESSMPGRAARIIARAAADGLKSVAMGPLESYRDFVDTRDIAAALLRLARAEPLDHRTFNVASGVAHQARDVVHRIAEAAGFDGEVVETATASPRSAHVAWQRADISRLTALGWHANHDLSSSIAALVASVQSGEMPGADDELQPR
jgi:nucleoside-diphosphate-sugar epimerase